MQTGHSFHVTVISLRPSRKYWKWSPLDHLTRWAVTQHPLWYNIMSAQLPAKKHKGPHMAHTRGAGPYCCHWRKIKIDRGKGSIIIDLWVHIFTHLIARLVQLSTLKFHPQTTIKKNVSEVLFFFSFWPQCQTQRGGGAYCHTAARLWGDNWDAELSCHPCLFTVRVCWLLLCQFCVSQPLSPK